MSFGHIHENSRAQNQKLKNFHKVPSNFYHFNVQIVLNEQIFTFLTLVANIFPKVVQKTQEFSQNSREISKEPQYSGKSTNL